MKGNVMMSEIITCKSCNRPLFKKESIDSEIICNDCRFHENKENKNDR